jgi:molybdopterin biosynthesis enzyme
MSKFVIPWLKKSLGLEEEVKYGILGKELNGSSDFTKFNIVKIKLNEQLQPVATPVPNNNSGDLFSLTKGDGFIELPPKVSTAKAGDSFKIWLYRNEII